MKNSAIDSTSEIFSADHDARGDDVLAAARPGRAAQLAEQVVEGVEDAEPGEHPVEDSDRDHPDEEQRDRQHQRDLERRPDVDVPQLQAGPAGTTAGGRGPRRARLQLRHIDTWSALKISLVLSIALFFIWMVAVGVLYLVLSGLGVFDTLNDLFGQLGSASGSKSGGSVVVTPGVVFGGAAVIGAINIVLLTALCTVGTFIYNLCSDLVGGLEVTLSERD
jgi:hypothetical protein